MDSATTPHSGTVRTGGRTERNRRAVLAAALEELSLYGYGGLSAARIADRAGVHRTTVHRRWPDLGELIIEALTESAAADIRMPDTGNIRTDLKALLRSIAARIDTIESRARIKALVSDTARSPQIGAVVRTVWTTRFQLGEAVIQRGIDRGELRNDAAPMTIFSMFIAPLYLRLLITDERLDHKFIDDVINLGLQGSQRRNPNGSET
jgi:AcrR family transcriptional regulator